MMACMPSRSSRAEVLQAVENHCMRDARDISHESTRGSLSQRHINGSEQFDKRMVLFRNQSLLTARPPPGFRYNAPLPMTPCWYPETGFASYVCQTASWSRHMLIADMSEVANLPGTTTPADLFDLIARTDARIYPDEDRTVFAFVPCGSDQEWGVMCKLEGQSLRDQPLSVVRVRIDDDLNPVVLSVPSSALWPWRPVHIQPHCLLQVVLTFRLGRSLCSASICVCSLLAPHLLRARCWVFGGFSTSSSAVGPQGVQQC